MGGSRGITESGELRGQGIYRAGMDQGVDYGRWKYNKVSNITFTDRVTLPPHRLFVSDIHTLDVTSVDDETF